MIRTRFLKAELAKAMNCVSDSAAAQHMEPDNERKLLVFNYRRRIRLSRYNFVWMFIFSAKLSIGFTGAYSRLNLLSIEIKISFLIWLSSIHFLSAAAKPNEGEPMAIVRGDSL